MTIDKRTTCTRTSQHPRLKTSLDIFGYFAYTFRDTNWNIEITQYRKPSFLYNMEPGDLSTFILKHLSISLDNF